MTISCDHFNITFAASHTFSFLSALLLHLSIQERADEESSTLIPNYFWLDCQEYTVYTANPLIIACTVCFDIPRQAELTHL
jgi:hypothetical protein